jgi:hypothetical protein
MQNPAQSENQCRYSEDPERFTGPLSTAMKYGDVCYVDSSGQFGQAKADSATTLPAVGIYAAHGHKIQYTGLFTKSDWAWTPGNLLYVSSGTAGALTATAPTAGGTFKQAMAVALSATTIMLLPSFYIVTN